MPDNGFGGRISLIILAVGFAWGCLLAYPVHLAAQTAQQMGVGTSPKFHTPSVPPPAGQDPWGPAKALGIAGNESYPIPPDLCDVDMYRQSKSDAAAKSHSCI